MPTTITRPDRLLGPAPENPTIEHMRLDGLVDYLLHDMSVPELLEKVAVWCDNKFIAQYVWESKVEATRIFKCIREIEDTIERIEKERSSSVAQTPPLGVILLHRPSGSVQYSRDGHSRACRRGDEDR